LADFTDQAEVKRPVVIEREKPLLVEEEGATDENKEEEEEEESRALSARPLSGRQARQLRSARIRSAATAEENVNPDRYMNIELVTLGHRSAY
jgi:hypothetical protein